MATLSDSVTVGILLTMVFGAICFYLYSRLTQNEKRVSLLENLLLSLKMNTEASLMGPDSVEPVSNPAPLSSSDVDDVDENEYAELLKDMGSPAREAPSQSEDATSSSPEVQDEEAAAELLRTMNPPRKMDANYESMSLKELQALVRERGLTAASQRSKRDLIDALKRTGLSVTPAAPAAPVVSTGPLTTLEGADAGVEGFAVSLEDNL